MLNSLRWFVYSTRLPYRRYFYYELQTQAIYVHVFMRNCNAAVAVLKFPTVARNSDLVKQKGRKLCTIIIQGGERSWISDYLGNSPLSSLRSFRRGFWILLVMFYKLLTDLKSSFANRWGHSLDAIGKQGLRLEIKLIAGLRIFGTARSFDDPNYGCRIGYETIRSYLYSFRWYIITL